VPRAPREITIVARDMTFYLDGRGRPNPTIRLAAGERVRIVLRNEDAGLTHDVVVRSLGIAAPTLKGLGSTSVTVEVPDAPGRHTYTCTPHAKMMSGLVEVR
jgi:plastocyanin